MKILIAVFAALALSACASPPASNAPALAASTSKAPYDYAMCVLPKWQRQAPGVALVEEGAAIAWRTPVSGWRCSRRGWQPGANP